METLRKPYDLNEIVLMYRNGHTSSKICLTFGLSERRYYELLKRHSHIFAGEEKNRMMNRRKKVELIKKHQSGLRATISASDKKITPEEKIAQLQKRLELEQKKNSELESLLKIAKDELGKL